MTVRPLGWTRGKMAAWRGALRHGRAIARALTSSMRSSPQPSVTAPPSRRAGHAPLRGGQDSVGALGAGKCSDRRTLCPERLNVSYVWHWTGGRRRRHSSVRCRWPLGMTLLMFVCLSGCVRDNVARTIAAENVIAAITAATSVMVNNVSSLFFG